MKLGIKDFFFVGVQFVLFGAYVFDFGLWTFELPQVLKTICLVFTFFGLGIIILSMLQLNTNLSPFPSPKAGSKLIQNGLYKYVRHPIYSGILITLCSYALYYESVYKLIILSLLYILFYFKSSYEEKRLLKTFPNYKIYKGNTGRFFPGI